jgi:hypothetical protein
MNHHYKIDVYNGQKNWMGDRVHPTDDIISGSAQYRAVSAKLREAYDKIEAAGLLVELDILIDAARAYELDLAAEHAAGAGI